MSKQLLFIKRNNQSIENRKQKKGERIMNKKGFMKVICLLLVMFMLIPMMPNALASTEDDSADKVKKKDESIETPFASATTDSAIGSKGVLIIHFDGLIDLLGDIDNWTIEVSHPEDNFETSSDKVDKTWNKAPYGGTYTVSVFADGKPLNLEGYVIVKQGGEEDKEYEITGNKFSFTSLDDKSSSIHFYKDNITLNFSPSIEIEKSGTFIEEGENNFADIGDKINYKFKVTNTGNVSLSDVTIVDEKLELSEELSNDLAPGASTTINADYVIIEKDITAGKVHNEVTVTGKGKDGDKTPVSDTDECTTNLEVLKQSPSIKIVKNGKFKDNNGNGFADVNEEIEYTFVVTNDGNVALENVIITDPQADIVSGGPITLNSGDVDTGSFTASYKISEVDINSGKYVNTATVIGYYGDLPSESVSSSDTETVTLKKGYNVIYDSNYGETSEKVLDPNSPYENNAQVTVLDNEFEIENYTFVEWNTLSNGEGTVYNKNDVITISSSDVTLYAQWEKEIDDDKDDEDNNSGDNDDEDNNSGTEDDKDDTDKDDKDKDDEPEIVPIDDTETPLGGGTILEPETPEVTPEEEIIAEQEVPLATTLPNTGSIFNTLTLIIIGSILIIAGLLLIKEEEVY